MKAKPFGWSIFGESMMRKLAYPAAIGAAVWVIGRVSVAKGDFWAPDEYGLAMLSLAMSALVVAVIRLGDGRFDTEKGKATRRNATYAAGVWLAAFALSTALVVAVALINRLPPRLDCWGAVQSQNSTTPDTQAACAMPKAKQ